MAEHNYQPTRIIDVMEGATARKVTELDLSRGEMDAARQFAAWWNDGILLRAADPYAPALTDAELMAIAGREGIGGFASLYAYDFNLRYVDVDTGRTAYPEPHVTSRGGYVTELRGEAGHPDKSPEVRRVVELVGEMCHRVTYDEPRKQQAQRREVAAQLAETQAERYAEGLRRVQELTARQRLYDEITAIKDAATRKKLMSEYPELFDGAEAMAMAEGIRMGTYAADVQAWQDRRTAETDADAAHGHDTTGTSLVQTPTVPDAD